MPATDEAKLTAAGEAVPGRGEAWRGRGTERWHSPAWSSTSISSRRDPMGRSLPCRSRRPGRSGRDSRPVAPRRAAAGAEVRVCLTIPPAAAAGFIYTPGSAPVWSETPPSAMSLSPSPRPVRSRSRLLAWRGEGEGWLALFAQHRLREGGREGLLEGH